MESVEPILDKFIIDDDNIKIPLLSELEIVSSRLISKPKKTAGEYYLLAALYYSADNFKNYFENMEISEKMGSKLAYVDKRITCIYVNEHEKSKKIYLKSSYDYVFNRDSFPYEYKSSALVKKYKEDLYKIKDKNFAGLILTKIAGFLSYEGNREEAIKIRLKIMDNENDLKLVLKSFPNFYWDIYVDYKHLGNIKEALIYLLKARMNYRNDNDIKDCDNEFYNLINQDRFMVCKLLNDIPSKSFIVLVARELPRFLSENNNLVNIVIDCL